MSIVALVRFDQMLVAAADVIVAFAFVRETYAKMRIIEISKQNNVNVETDQEIANLLFMLVQIIFS